MVGAVRKLGAQNRLPMRIDNIFVFEDLCCSVKILTKPFYILVKNNLSQIQNISK